MGPDDGKPHWSINYVVIRRMRDIRQKQKLLKDALILSKKPLNTRSRLLVVYKALNHILWPSSAEGDTKLSKEMV